MDTKYHEQYIRFGLKVQYYRKLSGMTQEAFADEIGKSWSFVAKIPRGLLASPWRRCSRLPMS